MRILYFLAMMCLISCSQREVSTAVVGERESPLTFDLDSLNNEKCVGEYCATLRIVWPVAKGDKSEKINQLVDEEVNNLMTYGEEIVVSRDSLIAGYFRSFEELRREIPDAPWGFEIDVEGELAYESDSTVSLHFRWMSFLGGAHPNHGESFLNLDRRTGEYLSIDRLIRDENKLQELAEMKFREFHEVEADVSLADDGRFFLPETGFFLPNAMGFQDGKFSIVYVPYEIGPYAMGYTHLEFSREELGNLVRW
jgi:hypothetical protein